MLTGKWTYRSYDNTPTLVGDDPQAALALIVGEGVLDLEAGEDDRFRGALGMANGYALTLRGEIQPGTLSAFSIVALGIDGTPTAGWRYDYHGVAGYEWPTGVEQVPSLLGTVVRVNAHGPSSPAGYTASFIAVRHGDDPAAPKRAAVLADQGSLGVARKTASGRVNPRHPCGGEITRMLSGRPIAPAARSSRARRAARLPRAWRPTTNARPLSAAAAARRTVSPVSTASGHSR